MNNENLNQHPAMINEGSTQPSTQHFADSYQQASIEDSRPPVDASAPSITPQAYESNTENLSALSGAVRSGTILNSTVFNISDRGVQRVNEYSHNSSNQAELRARQAEQRTRQTGRSIYQTPPTSGGGPSIQDEVKPTEEQLTKLRELEKLRSINQRVKSLQLDEQRTALKLKGIKEAIKYLLEEVEDLKN